jgi:hypothetical protein
VGIELRLLYDIVASFTVDYYSSDNVREKTRIGGRGRRVIFEVIFGWRKESWRNF